MDTHADTATDHMRVSNVETNTTTRTTQKPDTPTKCALCRGIHPSNYKGCECYHNIIRDRNHHRYSPEIETIQSTKITQHNPPFPKASHPRPQPKHPRTYAEFVNTKPQTTEYLTSTLTIFLGEFKKLFQQLIEQHDPKHALSANKRTPLNTTIIRIAQWNANGLNQHKNEIQLPTHQPN